MKKVLFVFAALMLMGGSLWAVNNPLAIVGGTVMAEAEDTVLPVLIFWVIGFGAVIGFTMRTWMPVFMAFVIAVIMSMSPNLAVSFTGWFSNAANVQTDMTNNAGF